MSEKPDITQEEREKFCKMAYEYGYTYFDHTFAEYETMEDISVLCDETSGNYSESKIIRHVEEYYGFERGKHDWDIFGIYGIIEDIGVCYEKGCKDALDNEEYNVESIKHMWNY
jgi:hypothetical protein